MKTAYRTSLNVSRRLDAISLLYAEYHHTIL